MTVPVYSGTVPNPVQSQPEFDTNTQEFIDYMAALAPALNDFAETINSTDTTSTSTTSVSIGTGTKNFTVETGKSYFLGMSLKIANTATNYMVGDVISYDTGTGALSVNVVAISGTGTYSSWTITVGFSGVIDTAQIANSAVTEDKIANNAVTTNKINNLAVTTAKINNAAVDATKITTTLFNELTTTAPAAGDLIPFADVSASNVNRKATAESIVKSVANLTGLGYSTGSGGTVTQQTSRTSSVQIDKTNGAITLFSAAGSTNNATFIVINSTVAATDVIIVNARSGTNTYVYDVTEVGNGGFNVTFRALTGTATDSPVMNFAVIKAVTS
jgi:hypothetical protein